MKETGGKKNPEDSDSATAPSTEESVVLHIVTLYLLVQYTVLFWRSRYKRN